MFYGLAIGDALGAPVETFSADKIRDIHGIIEYYVKPLEHKWFTGFTPGFVTDDTYFSLAIAKALIKAKKFCMDTIASEHIIAATSSKMRGMGNSTRDAIGKLARGASWAQSGISDIPGSGCGNGVVMKIAPLAAWFQVANTVTEPYIEIAKLAAMTHYTDLAVSSAIVHFDALLHCLSIESPHAYSNNFFCDDVTMGFKSIDEMVYPIFSPKLKQTDEDLWEKMHELKISHNAIPYWGYEHITTTFGYGNSYVYESLPFSYVFFMKNPHSIKAVLEVVNAGGDTDTNGSIVGALVGALNGEAVFPREFIDGLLCKSELEQVIEDFLKLFVR